MTQSMTAFSRVQKQSEMANFCWEIRSVNHRYLDVSFRLPESFRFLESELRTQMRDKVHRGKIECQLKYQDTNSQNQSMLIDIGTVNALMALSHQLASSHTLMEDLTTSKVLSWPGVIQTSNLNVDDFAPQVLESFVQAISELVKIRQVEGSALKKHIEERIKGLREELQKARQLVEQTENRTRDRLFERLQRIRAEVPEARVEQEMALLLARLDVSEELDRLGTHIDEVSRILGKEQVAGKRLDFLMQELNREANTLSSKSDFAELTRCAVEMKVLIEQMREQIQNIE